MANEIRLIDANALDAKIEKLAKKYEGRGRLEAAKDYRFVQTVLQCAPTVDAKPVVHGRWKYYHKQNTAVCTNCSFERDLDTNFGKAVSCPNCGADMRDGDGNG